MAFTEIDALNIMLENNGEDPISDSLSPKDPQVAKARSVLNRIVRQELQKGHNFNMQEKTLEVDENDVISVADSSFLNVYLPRSVGDTVAVRDNILWDRTNDIAYTTPIKVLVYLNTGLMGMPQVFREMVAYQAALEYISAYGSGMGSPQWAHVKIMRDSCLMTAYNSEFASIDNTGRLSMLYQIGGSVGLS